MGAGVPEVQAAAHVRLHARLIEENFATTSDVQRLEESIVDLKKMVVDLEKSTASRFEDLEKSTASRFEDLERSFRGEMQRSEERVKGDLLTEMQRSEERVKGDLRSELAEMEIRFTEKIGNKANDAFKWIIGLQIAFMSVVVATIKLL